MEARYYSLGQFRRIPNKKLRDMAVRMAVNDYFKGKEYKADVFRKYS
jgi:hypothetical protein